MLVAVLQRRGSIGGSTPSAISAKKKEKTDFGVYYDLCCTFEEDHEDEVKYAYMLESKTPENWDDLARQQLGLKEDI